MSLPVQLPQPLVIEAGGFPLSALLTGALSEIRVFQGLSRPALAEIVFQGSLDPDELASTFTHGSALRLANSSGMGELFNGEVSATSYEINAGMVPLFRVRAYDLLQRLRQRQTVRAFVDVNVTGLAAELAADLGITISGEEGPVWPRLIQHDQTDFGVLEGAADQAGLHFVLHEGDLRFLSMEGDGDAVPLRVGRTLREFRVETNSDRAWHEVAASSWNPHLAQCQNARADTASSLPDAPGVPLTDAPRHVVARTMVGEAHALALAQGELNHRRAASLNLWAVAEGDPELRPGRRVALEGAGNIFSGVYVVAQARHRFDVLRGFSTEISSRPEEPIDRGGSSTTLTVPGIVVRVDDPEDLSRIRVSLPTIGDVETDWMPVVLPAVGKGKGLIALPDVGDQVLVLCPGGDPSFGVVLGGLPGLDHHSDSGVGKDGIARYLFGNAAGQSLLLDAGRKSLKLENKIGGRLEITPGGVQLHSGGNLTIEAPGHTITIRGKAIQFEES